MMGCTRTICFARTSLSLPGCGTKCPTVGFGLDPVVPRPGGERQPLGQVGTLESSILVLTGSRQLFEQRLGIFEVGCVEALGEPAVDRCEEIVGLSPPALLHPQPRETGRRPERPAVGLLLVRDGQSAHQVGLRVFPRPLLGVKNRPRSRCNSAA